MGNTLSNYYNDFSRVGSTGIKTTTPAGIPIVPAPSFAAPEPEVPQVKTDTPVKTQTPIFSNPSSTTEATSSTVDLYAKYRDPKTGEIMSPEEYAIYLGNKVPRGNGEIPNYAGDAMTNPNETVNQLATRATNLNNSRNDIATGTTDPYKVGNKSGIAYSPKELEAIEKAYAGIYDPALNDVFARLKDKQAEEEKKLAREEKVFATNEAIRQWKATTGSKSGSGSGSGSGSKIFTQTQLNNGASNSGLSIDAFTSLDDDIKNFYINPPTGKDETGKNVATYKLFEEDLKAIAEGDLDPQVLIDEITNSSLPQSVKHYFINLIPDVPEEEKEAWYKRVWNFVTGK